MEKANVINFYKVVITNRVRSWKNGEITNAEYGNWILEVFERLQNFGLTFGEAENLINDIEKAGA